MSFYNSDFTTQSYGYHAPPPSPCLKPNTKTACLWSQRCRDFLQMENILECLNWLMHPRLGNCSSFLSYPRMIAPMAAYSLVLLPPHLTAIVHLRNPQFLSFGFLPPDNKNSNLTYGDGFICQLNQTIAPSYSFKH